MHQHLWTRGPVTDFTVTYTCDCGSAHKIQWAFIYESVSHVDILVTKAYGGTVHGESSGVTWEHCLSRRMLDIDQLGLRLHVEDMREDGEEC